MTETNLPPATRPMPRAARFRPLLVALILTLVLGAMLWLQSRAQQEFVARDRDAQMRLVGGTLTNTFDQAGKFALAMAESNARRGEIAAALAAGDREKLIALSRAGYDYLSKQAGVQIYGYHSKEIRYLLRMHRLDLANDDISGFRPMIVAANRLQRAQSGVEIGIAGIGIRGVALVKEGENFAGTTEIGLDLKPMLDAVKASTNADIAIVLSPPAVGIALDPKLPAFGDLVLSVSTDDTLFSNLLRAARLSMVRDTVVSTREIDGRSYSLITQPLVDFAGRHVGMSLALKPQSGAESRRIGTELIVVALCGGILAFIAFAALFRLGARKEEAA